MNDEEEIFYAINVVLDRCLELKTSTKSFYSEIYKYFLQLITPRLGHEIFLVSFSNNSSQLSQWRAYAPNNGVSFGVPFEIFLGLESNGWIEHGPVEYDQNKQASMVDPIIEDVAKRLQTQNGINVGDDVLFDNIITTAFMNIAPFIKHPFFHE